MGWRGAHAQKTPNCSIAKSEIFSELNFWCGRFSGGILENMMEF
jgi:hypothetical protein